jgi:NADH dehydrogenase
VEVTLVDRRNFHLFQPLLYQVATGGLSPGEIASPLRAVLQKQRNARVVLGEVVDIDVAARRVLLSDGVLDYDVLLVAAGATHHYFGHAEWAAHAPGLKTVEDATEIRRRFLLAFEIAEREPDPALREAWLTFVVVGAGPTGVELAGAMSEIANDTLKNDFRLIHPSDARIILLEAADRVLPPYPPELSAKAKRALERLGVAVRLSTGVTGVDATGVTVRVGSREEHIAARTVLWGAGVQASPLAGLLARAAGAETDKNGRVLVQPDLSLPGHPGSSPSATWRTSHRTAGRCPASRRWRWPRAGTWHAASPAEPRAATPSPSATSTRARWRRSGARRRSPTCASSDSPACWPG